MRKIIFVLIFVVSAFMVKAQNHEERKNEVLTYAEQMPEYVGGDSARAVFLRNNIIYPETARLNWKQAKVVIQFVVNAEGKISDVTALTHKGWGFEEEAIRVIKLMPDWIPGKTKGRPVSIRFSIPIYFKLSKDGK